MSRQIGVVVEGPTDAILLEAAITAILPGANFSLHSLQPKQSDMLSEKRGEGWGGVFRWCRDMAPLLESDPYLSQLDLIIIQVDGDVGEKGYADLGKDLRGLVQTNGLPCNRPCPPVMDSVQALEHEIIHAWMERPPGPRHVICIAARTIETWLFPALFPDEITAHLECHSNLAAYFAQKKWKLIRMSNQKKDVRNFRKVGPLLTKAWPEVKRYCETAALFDQRVRAVFK